MLSFRAASAALARTIRPVVRRQIGNDSKAINKEERSRLIDHAPGWSEEAATISEAFVKADREKVSIHEMQQRTVEYAKLHHDPTTHAPYARDEVGGPLGNAGVGEFEGVVGNDDLGPDDTTVESDGRVVTRRIIREKRAGEGQGNV